MRSARPLQYLWWLVSNASGIVALLLISISVVLGLTMSARLLAKRDVRRAAMRLHEHVALAALAAIAIHGLALLGDQWLKPGWRGIAVPFALSYRPAYTGLGIIAGYLGLLLGPSFYLRRRIGARRWRKLHRAIVIVWLLSVAHALGAGSDGERLWLRAIALSPLAPIVYLLVVRSFARPSTQSP
jgi:methionine sulfoxide reductase heme-binding subunit